jgi:hypothetical protein
MEEGLSMYQRSRKLTQDGAIVIKGDELIVREVDAVLRRSKEIAIRYGIAPEKHICAFVEMARHFCRLTSHQASSLREQLGGRAVGPR